ncbi:XdhC family protein [Microscilla marina]|uniref:Xanthine dehydrogenase accessory factor n=1 Tax=Microscilla marina ATCC 23134 TaxID=313606 RepID=A1ZVT1_MICM2|nr:XdhC/CoxI family protein [Microscilla marina]EAY25508.1 conserved hypothetical protein [Microscilla marina ATCC 23134]
MNIWQFINTQLEQYTPVMLLYVVESKGSSPGRQGFSIAVTQKALQGSIGGGIMEHKLVEWARDLLQKQPYEVQLKRQVHRKSEQKDQSGMICSGEQTIAFIPLVSKDLPVVQQVLNAASGLLKLSPQGLGFQTKAPALPRYQYFEATHQEWSFAEQIGVQNNVYIVGGGHVGLAFSQVMANLDFRIHIYDNRPGLNTMEANHYAHYKRVLPYDQLGEAIPAGANHYAVVMTFGYRSDDIAIRQLLGKPLKYLGLMGSQAKIDQLLANLRKDGFPEEQIKKVHTPIGIPIRSKTPAEIAISIAAEIIAVKNTE